MASEIFSISLIAFADILVLLSLMNTATIVAAVSLNGYAFKIPNEKIYVWMELIVLLKSIIALVSS